MSGFGGYGSTEIKIVLFGAVIGFFIGLPHGGVKAGLLGAAIGSIGLFAAILVIIFICWGIGKSIAWAKKAKNKLS